MNPSLRQKCILWGSAGGSGLLLMGCVVILYAQCRPTWVMWTPAAKIQDGVAHCWPTDILVDYSIVVGGALSCGRLTCMLALKLTNLTYGSYRGRCRCLSGCLPCCDYLETAYEYQEEDWVESGVGSRSWVSLGLNRVLEHADHSSACVMAIVKCTRLPTLYNTEDATCTFPTF